MNKGQSSRSYDGEARRRAAADRRSAVLAVAAEQFSEHGFEATTIPMIAEAAGVSVPYLERLGTKAEIIAMVLERVTVGAQHRTMQTVREDMATLTGGMTRDELLAFVSGGAADWNERSHRMWELWARAQDPAIHDRWIENMAHIRRDWALWLDSFADRGWWRTDVPVTELGVTCWLLTSPETYARLTIVAGFTRGEYVAWLKRGLSDALTPLG